MSFKVFRQEKVKKLPERATHGSAGYDIFSPHELVVKHGEVAVVETGLHFEFPSDFVMQLWCRSGLAKKQGITIVNSPGIIDSDYRGELKILLAKLTPGEYKVSEGDAVAQVGLLKLATCPLSVVDHQEDLSQTDRGHGGFGSTGR